MKLKSIMYAISYGKSVETLKRTEGARRVKQAKVLLKERCDRNITKALTWMDRYGSSSENLSQRFNVSKERCNELHSTLHYNFSDLEERVAAHCNEAK